MPHVAVLGDVCLGGATGILILLAISKATSTALPCGVTDYCRVLADSPLGKLYGIPISYLGAAFLVALIALRHSQVGIQFVSPMWIGASVYAGWLQWMSYNSHGSLCWWCASATVLLWVSLISTLTVGASLQPRSTAILVGALIAVTTTPFFSLANDASAKSSVKRSALIEGGEESRGYLVLVGSPCCPSCLNEVRSLAAEFRDGPAEKVRFVFTPRTSDYREVILAMRLKLAIRRKHYDWVQLFNPGLPIEEQLSQTDSISWDPALGEELYGECMRDMNRSSKLNIFRMPVRYNCKPYEDCVLAH